MGILTSLVKKRVRNGVTRLIIDFHFTNKSGERVRFVRHAELQTRDGAEREAARYHERAILTGDPEPVERSTMTLSFTARSLRVCSAAGIAASIGGTRYSIGETASKAAGAL